MPINECIKYLQLCDSKDIGNTMQMCMTLSRPNHTCIKSNRELPTLVQRADNHALKVHLIDYYRFSTWHNDADDLVKYLESGINGLRKEAFSLDTALSALIKKCTNIVDEQKSETENMLQILHKARDDQVCSLTYPYRWMVDERRLILSQNHVFCFDVEQPKRKKCCG